MAIDTTRYPRDKKVKEVKQPEELKKTEDVITLLREEDKRDPDGDSLTNKEEDTYGTLKDCYDTDGDGYGDGYEISNGTNPLIHDMIKTGDIEGLRSSLNEYSDHALNLITLRALSRLDKINRNDYLEQMGDILKNYPSLNKTNANPQSTISEKILGKTQESTPLKGLDMTIKHSESNQ